MDEISSEPEPLRGAAFEAVAPLYDELMYGVPYDDWLRYLRQLLDRRHVSPRSVLDLACGTGNMSERLALAGYAVTGVDISPRMIEEARRKAAVGPRPITYHVQDAAELDLPNASYDLCASLFDSMNYILEPNRLAQAIRRVYRHLAPGGLFVFDLNTEFALKNNFFAQNNLGTNARLRYDWDSIYFPQTRLCRVDMKFWYRADSGLDRTFEETHWQYAYHADEILKMLSDAGFSASETYQAYSLRPPTRTSDRIFYVAQK